MAAMDSCVLWRCPLCGKTVKVPPQTVAVLEREDGGFAHVQLGRVAGAACGCWVRRMPPGRLIHLCITLLAA